MSATFLFFILWCCCVLAVLCLLGLIDEFIAWRRRQRHARDERWYRLGEEEMASPTTPNEALR